MQVRRSLSQGNFPATVPWKRLIGNPGVGKSTLLNGLVGQAVFKSGVSFGEGLTKILQLHESRPGRWYGDTPGLADTAMRQKAAEEIGMALRQNGRYQLVFVVKEDSGRVRPQDVATIKLVLDALPKERSVPYGIVVNQITPRRIKMLTDNRESYCQFAASLNLGNANPTARIAFYPKNDELEDQSNAVHQIEQHLITFLANLPFVEIRSKEVADVNHHNFEAAMQRSTAEFEKQRRVAEAKLAEQKRKAEEQQRLAEAQRKEQCRVAEERRQEQWRAEERHRSQVEQEERARNVERARLQREHDAAVAYQRQVQARKNEGACVVGGSGAIIGGLMFGPVGLLVGFLGGAALGSR